MKGHWEDRDRKQGLVDESMPNAPEVTCCGKDDREGVNGGSEDPFRRGELIEGGSVLW